MKIMRGLAVVGYKNSGKTSLITEILKELKRREVKKITIFKHSGSEMGLDENYDTSKFFPLADQVIGSFNNASLEFKQGFTEFTNLINNLDCKILLVEGYKIMANMPRIICLNEKSDFQALSNSLEIGSFSYKVKGEDIWTLDDIGLIVDRILKTSFVLPNYNCGKCGRETCKGLALDMLRNKAGHKYCEFLEDGSLATLIVDGNTVRMKPFVAESLKNTISGFLKSLKDAKGESIEIKFNADQEDQ